MPTYTFECDPCGHVLELQQKFDDPPPECPICHESPMKRVIGKTTFVLKGSGWAKDGYK